jgi:AGCS family alanine or glycine:cation symporter
MALPNILGLFILGGDVKKELNVYMEKLKSGELDREAIR